MATEREEWYQDQEELTLWDEINVLDELFDNPEVNYEDQDESEEDNEK